MALMISWILLICQGKKVGGYLSDISGAFDRVSKEYLLAKLSAAGVGSTYLNFLDAYFLFFLFSPAHHWKKRKFSQPLKLSSSQNGILW